MADKIPYIEVWRAELQTSPANGTSPTEDDYGIMEDITTKVEPGVVLLRNLPQLDTLTLWTRPDNRSGGNPVEGTHENPLLGLDDIIQIVSYRDGADDSGNALGTGVVLFEGFVTSVGMDIRSLGGGEWRDRQVVICHHIGIRLMKDTSAQVVGQIWADAEGVERVVYGGPQPDLGQWVLNPSGLPNMDATRPLSAVWANETNAVSYNTFAPPGAARATHWTIGEAIKALVSRHNVVWDSGDVIASREPWIENPSKAKLEADGDFATAFARMNDRVPPSFVVNGDNLLVALTKLLAAGGFAGSVRETLGDGEFPGVQTRRFIEMWPMETGRSDKSLAMQSIGDTLNIVSGGDVETDDGSNVMVVGYNFQAHNAETAPIGLGGNDRYVVELELVGSWDFSSMPASDISDADRDKRYNRTGSEFLLSDYRNVFRTWSANFDETIETDGWNNPGAKNDISGTLNYVPVPRPRPFGRIRAASQTANETGLQRPLVYVRYNSVHPAHWRLLQLQATFHKYRDELYLSVADLNSIRIEDPTGGPNVSFWQACMNRRHAGATLQLKVICEVHGDRRLRVRTDRGTGDITSFQNGNLYDYRDERNIKSRQAGLPPDIINLIFNNDDTAAFTTQMNAVRDKNLPGSGSGRVLLATWDERYRVGDKILGIRGGRDISFEHGETGHFPFVTSVIYNLMARTIELTLGDLRRGGLR